MVKDDAGMTRVAIYDEESRWKTHAKSSESVIQLLLSIRIKLSARTAYCSMLSRKDGTLMR
jgi:hypothetical protein